MSCTTGSTHIPLLMAKACCMVFLITNRTIFTPMAIMLRVSSLKMSMMYRTRPNLACPSTIRQFLCIMIRHWCAKSSTCMTRQLSTSSSPQSSWSSIVKTRMRTTRASPFTSLRKKPISRAQMQRKLTGIRKCKKLNFIPLIRVIFTHLLIMNCCIKMLTRLNMGIIH